jgi:hypothetical protein
MASAAESPAAREPSPGRRGPSQKDDGQSSVNKEQFVRRSFRVRKKKNESIVALFRSSAARAEFVVSRDES